MIEDAATTPPLGWIDWTAAAVVVVFFVLGLFRGFVWQASRVATIVLAYVLGSLFGPFLASRIVHWFPPGTAPDLPRYTSYVLIFLGVLIVVGVLAGIVHRLIERSMLSFFNRVGGGLLGVATGWLFVMGGLTAIQVAYERAGFGGPVAAAASRSHSTEISARVLRATDRVIPIHWRRVTAAWRNLLRGEEVVDGDGDVHVEEPQLENPGDGSRRGPQSPR